MRGVGIHKILHMPLADARRSKPSIITHILVPHGLGVLFKIEALLSDMVATVANPILSSYIHKSKIKFVATGRSQES